MENQLVHEIELYPFDQFEALMEHEISMSRRYGRPLTLIRLAVDVDSGDPNAQYGAEIYAINALNLQVRETDIPCRQGNEFLVLMPSTDEKGGRIVCERLENLFHVQAQMYDKVSFKMTTYIGMTSLMGDRSLTSKKLMDNASRALVYAHENRLLKTVVFSDL